MNENKYKEYLKKNYQSLLATIGVSGIIFFIVILLIRYNMKNIIIDRKELNSLQIDNTQIPQTFEMIILFVSILLILCIPLTMIKDKLIPSIFIMVFIFLAFMDLILFSIIRINGEVNIYFVVITYIFICMLMWLLRGLLKYIYNWLADKDQERNIDVAKLTFIWAVITFILNMIWLGKN